MLVSNRNFSVVLFKWEKENTFESVWHEIAVEHTQILTPLQEKTKGKLIELVPEQSKWLVAHPDYVFQY